MTFRALAAAIAASLFLSACGGGGDDGGSTARASSGSDVSASNYTTLSTPFVRAVLYTSDEGTASALSATNRSASLAASRALSIVRTRALGHERALAVSSTTEACAGGGTMTISHNDANDDRVVDTGESVTFQLNNCAVEPGDAPSNGTLTMTFHSVQYDSGGEAMSLDMTVSMSGFPEGDWDSVNGSFRVRARLLNGTDTTEVSITFTSFAVTESGSTVVYDFTWTGTSTGTGSSNFSVNGTVTIAGETYVIESTTLAQDGGPGPLSGEATLRDAAGDRLVVKARSSTTYDLEFYPAGASTPTATSSGLSWAAAL